MARPAGAGVAAKVSDELPRRFPAWWAWLFPATYVAHVAEEYGVGEGFPAWIDRVAGVELAAGQFLALNVVGLVLMLVGVWLVLRERRMEWILTTAATAFLLNTLSHAVASAATLTYSPGLATGVALWAPLSAWTLWRAWRTTSLTPFVRAVAIGLAAHVVVLASLAVQ